MHISNKKIKKARASARYIYRLECPVGGFNTTNVSLNEDKWELSDAYFKYKLVRKSAQKMRKDWMEELSSRQVDDHGGTAASQLSTILHYDDQ